jgi:monovalent cation:H+ antiporter-2, CPA2 family
VSRTMAIKPSVTSFQCETCSGCCFSPPSACSSTRRFCSTIWGWYCSWYYWWRWAKGSFLAPYPRLFGYRNVVPLAVGLGLFQVGEFSFVLARVGLDTQAISPETYALALTTAIATIVLTPFVSGFTAPLYALRRHRFIYEPLQTINVPRTGLHEHIVIAGGGRVGQCVAQVLQRLGLGFVIIELDTRRFEQAKASGWPIIFGDASQEIVLEAASIAQARLLLITVPAIITAHTIVDRVHHRYPGLHIVARAAGVEQMQTLHARGVFEVVQPEFEAGLEMTRQALFHLHIPIAEIQRFTDAMHRELYAPLYQNHTEYQALALLHQAPRLLDLTWIPLALESPLLGRTIRDLSIRSQTGATVVGVLRDGMLQPNPDADYCFAPGDVVGVIGRPKQLETFQTVAAPNGSGIGAQSSVHATAWAAHQQRLR